MLKTNLDTFRCTLMMVSSGFQQSVKYLGETTQHDFQEYKPLKKCHTAQGYVQLQKLCFSSRTWHFTTDIFYHQQEIGFEIAN